MFDLTRTDMRMTELTGGSVTDHGDFHVVKTPQNPNYYHGNYLFLREPPRDLARWSQTVETVLGTAHVCLRWDGPALSESALEAAARDGFSPDHGIAMEMTAPGDVTRNPDLTVRPLEIAREWQALVDLNRLVDPTEAEEVGNEHYRAFKDSLRSSWRTWLASGAAIWWGAFAGQELVGACGLVDCPGGDPGQPGSLGRFQSVETHPGYRRQGVCSTLVTAVAEHALQRHRVLLLAAEPDGPALGLYRRLGFVEVGWQRTLLRSGQSVTVREEEATDRAGVRSMVRAAFGQDGEVALLDKLDGLPGAISLVADRDGKILGHAYFTPVEVVDGEDPGRRWQAIALGPMAVRPGFQRRGIGAALIEAGLERCREAGYPACLVLGHPEYYPRFGFEPAHRYGLRPTWPVPPEVFMVVELQPGALDGRAGEVRYHPAFDEV